MVQLKGSSSVKSLAISTLFQFQYGTIKSQFFLGLQVINSLFQFQYGTIKSIFYNILIFPQT